MKPCTNSHLEINSLQQAMKVILFLQMHGTFSLFSLSRLGSEWVKDFHARFTTGSAIIIRKLKSSAGIRDFEWGSVIRTDLGGSICLVPSTCRLINLTANAGMVSVRGRQVLVIYDEISVRISTVPAHVGLLSGNPIQEIWEIHQVCSQLSSITLNHDH